MVNFTGSDAVGSAVMAQASSTTKKVVLELGGKSAFVVLGSDLAGAADTAMVRFCRNAGQGCVATTRILVPRADADAFVNHARRFLREQIVVGPPDDPAVTVGPVISVAHRERVEGFLSRATADGARPAFGRDRPDGLGEGFYLNPALVLDADPGLEIAQEEVFGPVAVLLPYDTVEEAVDIANGSRYALNAIVWGPPDLGSAANV